MDSAGTDDSGDRLRIAGDLDANLMVVAGAGTGKTTALVQRIVALVSSGAASLGQIAAMTFTEAAADELRHRVRRALDEAAAGGDVTLTAARDEVDEAAIGTVHAFAQRILLEQCVAAGLPPGFDVLDDAADAADFDAAWTRFADTLFAAPTAERALVLGLAAGLRHADLAAVARALRDHWDRLEDGGLDYLLQARPCDDHWPATDPGPVIEALDGALGTVGWCTDDADNLVLHLRNTVADARARLAAAPSDTLGVLHLLDTMAPLRCSQGRQENWGGRIAEARAACARAEQARLDHLDAVRGAALGDLVARLATFTLVAAEERRAQGRLTFHDLLVHARRLLRGGGDALAATRRRYRRLLIDEFQDTDPLQVELAALLAADVDGPAAVGDARPGALFVVGDPTQSIYRFRRADIDLFDRVSADMGPGAVLRNNYRSVPGIVDFVNVVFDEILGHGTIPGQAPHHTLVPARRAGDGGDAGPEVRAPADVVQLSFAGIEAAAPVAARRRAGGAPAPGPTPPQPSPVVTVGGALATSTPEVRRRAAADAAAAVDLMVGHRWLVEEADDGAGRPVRFGDVAVLIPARSSLPALEEAFEEAGVPYRLEGAALLWGAEEVREVLTVLRASDDPADAVAVLGALRSPGLACGDDDLVTWHGAGGGWDPGAPPPPGLEAHPVAAAMAVLDRLHHRRFWSEPSAMVAAAYDELRSFELALVHRRPRDHWQRLRWLQDQARLFDETDGGTLGAFLAWARIRAAGDGRSGGVGPPDPDDDAVRVMTIHGAKGLEFPVVVVAGLERDRADGPVPPPVLWTEHHIPEVSVGPFRTAGFEQAALRAQGLDVLEQHRLLYVAMTRARDHLVLCLHHRRRNGTADGSLAALVTRICLEHPRLWRGLPDQAPGTVNEAGWPDPGDGVGASPGAGGGGEPLPAGWQTERSRLLEAGRRRPVITATAVARDRGPDRDSGAGVGRPGGRHGPAVEGEGGDGPRRLGRAVHGALARLDLATGCDAAGRPAHDVARDQAVAEGVGGLGPEVAALVERALASPTVVLAASRRHWREVFVTAPVGPGAALEGVVDLLFEGGGGLVVVDYKTEGAPGGPVGSEGSAAHRLQVAAYAEALESATGRAVGRGVLVYLGGPAPVEHVIEGDDLARFRADVRARADALVAP